MRKSIVLFLIACGVQAQTLLPTLPAESPADSSVTLTLTFTAGTTSVAALQWSWMVPAGATVTWSTSLSDKSIDCSASLCLLFGINSDVINTGVVATASITFPDSLSGSQAVSVQNIVASDVMGNSVVVTGGGASTTLAETISAPVATQAVPQ